MPTAEELVQHGAAIERMMQDEAVQKTFDLVNEGYYAHWKAAESLEVREILWHDMRALGRLELAFRTAVDVGQAELVRLEAAEKPTSRL